MSKKLDENYKFARFLKNHAEEEEFDKRIKELHNKYFKIYDCSKCLNCCKKLNVSFSNKEIEAGSKELKCTVEELKNKYLTFDKLENKYITKTTPCPFLKNQQCILKNSKPKNCKDYPYTNKKERIHSLYTLVNNAEICPVVDKILDELKSIYHFKVR